MLKASCLSRKPENLLTALSIDVVSEIHRARVERISADRLRSSWGGSRCRRLAPVLGLGHSVLSSGEHHSLRKWESMYLGTSPSSSFWVALGRLSSEHGDCEDGKGSKEGSLARRPPSARAFATGTLKSIRHEPIPGRMIVMTTEAVTGCRYNRR